MLTQLLAQKARELPSKTALLLGDLAISYQALLRAVLTFSQTLSLHDVGQGDCIALLLPNGPEFVISFYAVAQLHAINLTLNPLYKEAELEYYLQENNVRAVITHPMYLQTCQSICQKLMKNIPIILLHKEVLKTMLSPVSAYVGLETSVEYVPYDGVALYQYSSGSTGMPKRVDRTQYNLFHESKNVAETIPVTSADNILCTVPLFHTYGLACCMLLVMYTGATLVFLDHVEQQGKIIEIPFIFRVAQVLEVMQTRNITCLPTVPYIFKALAEAPSDLAPDLSCLRLCLSAGNFLSTEIFAAFYERFGVPILNLYGCTEMGVVAIARDTGNISATSAYPIRHTSVKIVDENKHEVPDGTIGEIAVKSLALTQGYGNRPDLNSLVFQQGYYFTGDLGKMDHSGRLSLTGRKNLFIDTGGHKVDPQEVEQILLKHEAVAEAVVVGSPTSLGTEQIRAFVVLSTSSCTERELIEFSSKYLADYKVPRRITILKELPKSPLGKILRKDLLSMTL